MTDQNPGQFQSEEPQGSSETRHKVLPEALLDDRNVKPDFEHCPRGSNLLPSATIVDNHMNCLDEDDGVRQQPYMDAELLSSQAICPKDQQFTEVAASVHLSVLDECQEGFVPTRKEDVLSQRESVDKTLEAQRLEIRALEQDKQRLLQESLSTVDTFSPESDETFQRHVVDLNKKIGPLVKRMIRYINQQQLLENSMSEKEGKVFMPNSINMTTAGSVMRSKRTAKLLLRHTIWKFIVGSLVKPDCPFETFGGKLAGSKDKLQDVLLHLFAGDSQSAVRWRILSLRQLEETEDAEDKQAFLSAMKCRLLDWLCPTLPFEDDQAFRIAMDEEVLNDRLLEVFDVAIKMSRLIFRQRARYTFEAPIQLSAGDYRKKKDSEYITNVGSRLGVDEATDEVEASGNITFLVSPALLKWGNGNGEKLQECTLLAKAVVEINGGDGSGH